MLEFAQMIDIDELTTTFARGHGLLLSDQVLNNKKELKLLSVCDNYVILPKKRY